MNPQEQSSWRPSRFGKSWGLGCRQECNCQHSWGSQPTRKT